MSNQAMREEWGFLDERAALEALRSQSMIGVPLNESGAINLCHAYQVARFAAIAAHEREKAGAQEPLFWYRPRSDGLYEGPIHDAQIEQVRKESGGWVPLYPMAQALREAAEKMVEATNYRAAVFAASNDVNKQQFADTKFWEAHDNLDAALSQQKENNQICPVNNKELSAKL